MDVALMQVSPPDRHGYCSLGVSVGPSVSAIKCAKHVIAQVNKHMPVSITTWNILQHNATQRNTKRHSVTYYSRRHYNTTQHRNITKFNLFVIQRTHGNGIIHVSAFDAIVEGDMPLPELKEIELTETIQTIGKNVAALVENGAALQMGIGAIPDAVLAELTHHKDLGIHTEMFSDVR